MALQTLKPRLQTLSTAVRSAATVERERGTTNQRTRERLLSRNPLCARCEANGRVSVATQLDHIVALANGGTNDDSNRQGLCDECHRIKTDEDLGRR